MSLETTIFGKITHLGDDRNLSCLRWNAKCDAILRSYNIGKLIKILGIQKSATFSKTDISINGKQFSVKEINGAPAAIINHTPRPGFERICDKLGIGISELDEIIEHYWKLRKNGDIKEDTKISDERCPFVAHKKFLKDVINYFIFDGSGSRDSPYPADAILEIDYKKLPKRMKVIGKDDYFEGVWPKLIFSVRSKGMPPTYPRCDGADSIKKWTRRADDLFKGSLHVRVG